MLDFTFKNDTGIFFGTGGLDKLGKAISARTSHVLLVYGGGSIKSNGIYDEVTGVLTENGIEWAELPGVKPNPRIDSVRAGIAMCRELGIDFVLAVGGGSVIDCAKGIAAGFYHDGDPWDFYTWRARIKNALPIATVLTLAATGSEMNGNTVITNMDTKEKLGIGSPLLKPQFSALNPEFTFTVPRDQTANGIADIMSHVFEQYFSPVEYTFLQDRLCEAILKTCLEIGPQVIEEPDNYEARAQIMWAGTLALNGLLAAGKGGDWATHKIEHSVSAFYDIAHGAGLAVLTPHWMEYVLDDGNAAKFATLARNLFSIDNEDDMEAARRGIEHLVMFWSSLGLPATLSEMGIEEDNLPLLAKDAVNTPTHTTGELKKLGYDDVLEIYKRAF